ncbi:MULTISPECIES: Na+/H+ antiporter subunit E [unclassified Roseateles]|uniref:Na+/H+ antiporter subunit E n=1 Tax=unclassified Roseateles TaxID=2626991 RepID=UPI0022B8883B|nr:MULTISPECIES: Na+/H+ antiporter subunit E [unclassified Roseateles]MCZ7882919.1 Na+/H+ antiporter subunit E [Paucibacter sp. M5-1]MDC6169935.1 Na+/H+ antiporter subunit E [Paucibacter sp. XJ19-41]
MPDKKWLSHPLLSLLLAAVWLLLQQSLALPQLITAALLGLLLPRLLLGFLGPALRLRKPGLALRLVFIVLWDIVMSNLVVARLVLSPAARPQPAWVPVPLALRQPGAISLMASIITMTPGTVSCVVDEERHEILVHALDCSDPLALAAEIKSRYERPLLEIFA